jgi:predicted sulfurtransferase
VFKMIGATQDRDDAEAFTKYVQRLQPELQSLFLRRVSESSFIGHYVSVAAFGEMLRDNKIYYKV